MKVMPIRYVADVEASRRFYAALGLAPDVSSRSGNWSELVGGGGILALHTLRQAASTPDDSRLELCFVTEEPLEALTARLESEGIDHGGIVDENFGRLLRVTDPDGLVIQINEHDAELYS
jgi:catechol 2,3-dioxygenase-like lactoylglutathione lyase family enzyme